MIMVSIINHGPKGSFLSNSRSSNKAVTSDLFRKITTNSVPSTCELKPSENQDQKSFVIHPFHLAVWQYKMAFSLLTREL